MIFYITSIVDKGTPNIRSNNFTIGTIDSMRYIIDNPRLMNLLGINKEMTDLKELNRLSKLYNRVISYNYKAYLTASDHHHEWQQVISMIKSHGFLQFVSEELLYMIFLAGKILCDNQYVQSKMRSVARHILLYGNLASRPEVKMNILILDVSSESSKELEDIVAKKGINGALNDCSILKIDLSYIDPGSRIFNNLSGNKEYSISQKNEHQSRVIIRLSYGKNYLSNNTIDRNFPRPQDKSKLLSFLG